MSVRERYDADRPAPDVPAIVLAIALVLEALTALCAVAAVLAVAADQLAWSLAFAVLSVACYELAGEQ